VVALYRESLGRPHDSIFNMKDEPTIVTRETFTALSSRYDFLCAHYKKGVILDIGNVGGLYGGEGTINSSHLKFVARAKESTVYGHDLYPPKVDREKYERQTSGDIEKGLPYEDNFFDTVYLGEVIEHLHNPGMVLKEVRRVLKEDGVFIMDTPNAYSAEKFVRWIFARKENLGDPTHVIIFTPGSLIALLKKNGFNPTVVGEKRSGRISVLLGKGAGSHLLVKAEKA
jgi:SAM-dependent methyltransferase